MNSASQHLPAGFYCVACESRAVTPARLGFIGDDGALGKIAGFACRSCQAIWTAADAVPIITGHVELGGRRAIDWLVAGLRAAGCAPRARR